MLIQIFDDDGKLKAILKLKEYEQQERIEDIIQDITVGQYDYNLIEIDD